MQLVPDELVSTMSQNYFNFGSQYLQDSFTMILSWMVLYMGDIGQLPPAR